MADVRVTVNEQIYTLSCDDGEEPRVEALAAYLDDHVRRFADNIGRAAEQRLLILAALTVCDELFTAREELAALTADRRKLEQLADRAEGLAAKAAS